jgi:hypothetical protein
LWSIDLDRAHERDKAEWNSLQSVFGDPKPMPPALLNRSFGANWQLVCLIDPYDTLIEHQRIGTLPKEFRFVEEYCISDPRHWTA